MSEQRNESVSVRIAADDNDFEEVKKLVLAYVDSLGFDISFQNFDAEIASLPAMYGPPVGGMFLAVVNGVSVGVAGIRRLNDTECELKRMYVKPGNRGLGLGRKLIDACVTHAENLGYKAIKLDTTTDMKSAMELYQSCGFREIPPYYFNPQGNAKYFSLALT